MMHLIFERSEGRFKSNTNILSLAWIPYYEETKFRQALCDYHQKQLISLTSSIPANVTLNEAIRNNLHTRQRESRLNDANNNQSGQDDGREAPNLSNQLEQRLNEFTNTRVTEFYRRSSILKSNVVKDNQHSSPAQEDSECSLSTSFDKNYGRMPDFGWLAVGNVGKVVGLTLTSVAEPIREEPVASNDHDNLMQFQEPNPSEEGSSARYNSATQSGDLFRPDRKSMRSNHNLRGHLGDVILVKWNELYQKLATVDSEGNVLIWGKINEKFTIQTPFYNKQKVVADFKWSNDGKTALICYTDSFILVGSSSGQRHWHSMLNLNDYIITCASWAPNDQKLLLGVSNGNVVVIDLPRSELTELVVNQTNVRTMCWSTCNISVDNMSKLLKNNWFGPGLNQDSINRRTSTVVNHRRLSSDCSVFSRYMFCLQGLNNTRRPELTSSIDNKTNSQANLEDGLRYRNILAIDFANNTIKLYDGGLDDANPKTIQANLESYTMHWSSDGKMLAVAGFNMYAFTPSIGCIKLRYLNQIKFFNQDGKLIYEYDLNYTRYPITAFTWAYDDKRVFLATGPKLHCAKVYYGIPTLSLLAMSTFQRYTKIPDKNDIVKAVFQNHCSINISSWSSKNCPLDIKKYLYPKNKQLETTQSESYFCNNTNIFHCQLPLKLQINIDKLFTQTIRQPYDEHWSLSDIIWHVPHNDQRYYCTLVCYAGEHQVSRTGYKTKPDAPDMSLFDQSSNQYKIFVLYVEFQGSLIPILRARRIGFLKPEFVIFDPEGNKVTQQKQRKVSDISQHVCPPKGVVQRQLDNQYSISQQHADISQTVSGLSPFYSNEGFDGNCSDLHLFSDSRVTNSSQGRQSRMSDSENYYNFNSESLSRKTQEKVDDLISDRSNQQEPIALPMTCKPHLLFMKSIASDHQRLQDKFKDWNPLKAPTDSMTIDKSWKRKHHMTSKLTESSELVRIKSNIWGTKFKLINISNDMIKHHSIIGTVLYKASILHLQPRQIFLDIKDMSNYCCLCSKHHHTRTNNIKNSFPKRNSVPDNTVSLLDLPNYEPDFLNTINAGKKYADSNRFQNDKVIIPVGDSIRIAPKLDKNQQYRFKNHSAIDYQAPSTSKEHSRRSNHSTPKRSDELSEARRNSRRSRTESGKDVSHTSRSTKTQHAVSETHARYYRHPDSSKSSLRSRLEKQSTNTSDVVDVKSSQPEDQDDILTLELEKDDKLHVVMSSKSDLLVDKPNSDKLDDFLAENKTLKSIQSITKMIVGLSKLNDEGTDGNCADIEVSPSKQAKFSDDSKPFESSKYIPPETPVHRPRKTSMARYNQSISNDSCFQTRSATTTPQRVSNMIGYKRKRNLVNRDVPSVPLPPPPPSVPISRKLSGSAKRFIDGSLRSLYGTNMSGSTTDVDPLESECLLSGSRPPKSRMKHIKSLVNQSQPCSPSRTFIQLGKQSSDLSQFRDQLVEKFRSFKSNESNPVSTKFKSTDHLSNNSFHNRNKLPRRYNQKKLSHDFANLFHSSNELSSGSESDIDCYSESYDDAKLDYLEGGVDYSGSKSRKQGKADRSSSVKNLMDLDKMRINNSNLKEMPNQVSNRRKQYYRRKSICKNSTSCCCAKEFKLNNRPPVWNEQSQVYQLDFGGRVTQESAKNLQIDFEGKLALQFGRIDNCTYTLDYKYPFNAVQAMGIALASLTQRLK